jgi:ABC-type transport system involved in cytochrome c biogenesis permease subunit
MRLATRLLPLLLLITAVFFIRAPFLIQAAPIESTMGAVQKIFYFHVPAAAATFLAATVCGVASLLFLWRRRPMADHVAVSAAELVVIFGVIVLITGPLWARKAWGIWWEWRDVRLTTTFVMWTTFAAYLLLRRFGGPSWPLPSGCSGWLSFPSCISRSATGTRCTPRPRWCDRCRRKWPARSGGRLRRSCCCLRH